MSKFLYGAQTHFNGWVPPEILQGLADRRFTMARIDAQASDLIALAAMIQQAKDADLEPLVVVSSLEQIQLLPAGTRCELWNEPDLALGRPTPIPPAKYAAALAQAAPVAADRGVILYAPVVSNLNERGLTYLRDIGPLPDGVRCSVHRYGNNTFSYAHPPASTREAEVDALKAIIGDTPFGVSEMGYHRAKTGWWIFATRLSEQAQADYAIQEWEFWQRMGAEFAVWYQLFNGRADRPLERYGLYDPTAQRWTLAAETVPKTEPPMPPETKHAAFAVVVTNEQTGAPVKDATVLVSTGGQQGKTNADGYVVFIVEQKPLTFSVHHPSYADYASPVVEIHGDLQLGVKVQSTGPIVVPRQRIIVKGRDFFLADGTRHMICGSTELLLAWVYDTKGPDAATEILEDRKAVGLTDFRVLWQKDLRNANVPWLMPLDKIPAFLEHCKPYGWVQGTILADCQVVNTLAATQIQRVSDVRGVSAGKDNHREQLGNEFSKNGFEPAHFSKPPDRLAANASNTEGGAYAPFWDYMCFSGQRGPLNHAIREYGPIEFIYGDVAAGVQIPAICDEGMIPGENSHDPRDFERAGAQARSGNGGRFHSRAGTNRDDMSRRFTSLEKECAIAFVKGMGQ